MTPLRERASAAPHETVRWPFAWAGFLVVGVVLAALYLFVAPFKGSGPVFNLLGFAPVVAILVGIRLHRPSSRAPWLLFAAGSALFFAGDLYTYSYPLLLGGDVPFPSPGDGLYILVYPVIMAGLILLVRRRGAGAERGGSLIDGLILTVGLALPSWVALMAPYIHLDDLSFSAKLVSVAYPLGDVILLGAAVRLALDAGRRPPAFYLLSSSIVLLLATDFAYGLLILDGTYAHQLWLDLGWIGFYLLWGAGALHPSMARLDQPGDERESVLTRSRLGLLTCASLIAPVIGIIHELRVGDVDYLVVRVASGTLFLLVILRMAGLVRQQERSLERERILSRAGAELVAASSREEIDHVAVGAAGSLGGPQTIAALCRIGSDGSIALVEADGPEPGATTRKLPHGRIATVIAEGGEMIRLSGAETAALGLEAEHDRAFVVPLGPRRAEPVWLVLAGGPVSGAVRAAARALKTQVALALDSAVLTEEVHRRRGEARFGSLVRHASDLITVLDPDLMVTYQSPSVERVLGFSSDAILGRPFTELVCAADRERLTRVVSDAMAAGEEVKALECALLQSDGVERQFQILFTNLLDDEHVGGFVLNARDVSERKVFEDELRHQAFHDTVTGLANRASFSERVRHAITRGRREGRTLAVIFLDLDDFKTINDSLGHAAGDQVLVEVARRLDATVRGADTAARFGGDEFAVLLEDVTDSQQAADTAQRILEALAAPIRAGHKELALRASLGISVALHDDARNADELIRDADAAMYISKRDGKGTYRLFEPTMHEGVLARLELRTDLQRAIATDQLELHYQPLVRLSDASVVGVEALLRWRHPERGTIAPGDFIPIAEETGLIIPIGRWVLREGCRHAQRILKAMPDAGYDMSINLSLKQIQHSDIVADVRDALADSGLAAERLTLEITESVLMHDTELAVDRLKDLKALGVRLALDDFGTGYSSLSYLSRFPVDILKMDRSFLREGSSPAANGLATAVLGLGATLSLEVVAEGIETEEQWHVLRELGCDFGQGFLFARPKNADASLAFLAAQAVPSLDAP